MDIPDDTGSGDNEVHEHIVFQGKIGYLKNDMLHYAYPTIDVWIEKHNRYSNWEARVISGIDNGSQNVKLKVNFFGNSLERKRWLKKAALNMPFRPTLRFLYHYIWKHGFRDGYRGWVFCRLLAWYEFVSIAKNKELNIMDNIQE